MLIVLGDFATNIMVVAHYHDVRRTYVDVSSISPSEKIYLCAPVHDQQG
jgi:hypothetical protein